MNDMNIKAGLRRLFICTGMGLILISAAGCTLQTKGEWKPNVVNILAEEMIDIPWNEGWNAAISVTPGIPIELSGSDDVRYEISGDTNHLCVYQDRRLVSMEEADTTMKAGDRFLWNPFCGNNGEKHDEIEASWIHIVRKQEGYSTGMVLVRISAMDKTGHEDRLATFQADTVASLDFPGQEGMSQNISDAALQELIASYQ